MVWARRRLVHVALFLLAGVLLTSCGSSAIDDRWFGWVREYGAFDHRVCGEAYIGIDEASGTSTSWYQGYGQTNPGCARAQGDVVATGWLGAAVNTYQNGSLCADSSWRYNVGDATEITQGAHCNPQAGVQDWQSYAHHYWWAYDINNYAYGAHYSPVWQN